MARLNTSIGKSSSTGTPGSARKTELDAECLHEIPESTCGFCQPPRAGMPAYVWITLRGEHFHRDPSCEWLHKGHDRARERGLANHPPVKVAAGSGRLDAYIHCQYCFPDLR